MSPNSQNQTKSVASEKMTIAPKASAAKAPAAKAPALKKPTLKKPTVEAKPGVAKPAASAESSAPILNSQEGDQAPAFSLPDESGTTFNIAQHLGKIVVLFFYPKDDTSMCTLEALEFSERKTQFDQAGIVLCGISRDPVKSHVKFRAKHGLQIRLLSDEGAGLAASLGIWVEKSMYGRKYMGVERATFVIGRDGNFLKIWRKVSAPGHAQEVLEFVRNSA